MSWRRTSNPDAAWQAPAWRLCALVLLVAGCGRPAAELPSVDGVREQFAQDGRFDELSLQSLRTLHAQLPQDEGVSGLLETALLEREDWNDLVALLYDPTERTRDLDRAVQLASVLVRAQRLSEAAEVLAQQRASDPDHSKLIWLSAYTAFHRGRHDEAAELLDGHLEALVDAGISDALLLRGEVALQRDNPQGAREPIERFVAARPEHAAGHNALGRLLAMAGDEAGAREHLDRARDLYADVSRLESRQVRLSAQASALNAAFAQRDYSVCERLLADMLPAADASLKAGLYRMAARMHQARGHSDLADEALRQAARIEVEPR